MIREVIWVLWFGSAGGGRLAEAAHRGVDWAAKEGSAGEVGAGELPWKPGVSRAEYPAALGRQVHAVRKLVVREGRRPDGIAAALERGIVDAE